MKITAFLWSQANRTRLVATSFRTTSQAQKATGLYGQDWDDLRDTIRSTLKNQAVSSWSQMSLDEQTALFNKAKENLKEHGLSGVRTDVIVWTLQHTLQNTLKNQKDTNQRNFHTDEWRHRFPHKLSETEFRMHYRVFKQLVMQAFASQESYFDNYWDDVPIKVKMEAVKQVQKALVEQGMPIMAEEDILQRLRKRANVERRLRREHSGKSQG